MKNITNPNGAFYSDLMTALIEEIPHSDCLKQNVALQAEQYLIPQSTLLVQLVHFLQEELKIPAEAIALSHCEETGLPHLLPMVLWQSGLVSLVQLEQIFNWLDTIQS